MDPSYSRTVLTLASLTLVDASADFDRCVEVNRWDRSTIPIGPEFGGFHWIPRYIGIDTFMGEELEMSPGGYGVVEMDKPEPVLRTYLLVRIKTLAFWVR